MQTIIVLLIVAAITMNVPTVCAHHAPFAYDLDRTVTVRGLVSDVRWANPHVEVVVSGADSSGAEVEWVLETLPPHSLGRSGMSERDFGLGQLAEFDAYPAREPGRTFAWARAVRIAGGPLRELPEQGVFRQISFR